MILKLGFFFIYLILPSLSKHSLINHLSSSNKLFNFSNKAGFAFSQPFINIQSPFSTLFISYESNH